jgi:TRAP-type mannitol/chloroaromatic compound transport system permease small subunit
MQLIKRIVSKTGYVVTLMSGASILIVMFIDTWDVLSTNLLNQAVPGTIEITQSTMVMVVFGGLAYTQLKRGHIRMELLYMNVSRRGQALMDVVSEIFAIIYFIAIALTSGYEMIESWKLQEISVGLIQFPIYPVRTVLVIGVVVLLFQLVNDLVDDLSIVRGKQQPIQPSRPAIDGIKY